MSFPRLGSLMALEKEAENTDEKFEMSAQMQRAKDQIEYYLCGANLERDTWMREQESKYPDRFIPVSVFMSCARIKQLGITEDDLLLACTKSFFLEVDLSKSAIRHKKPFKSDVRRKYRTIKARGFDSDCTVEDVYSIFNELVAPPESVSFQFKKVDDISIFNGLVLIEFAEETDAEKALSTEIYFGGSQIKMERFSDTERKKKK